MTAAGWLETGVAAQALEERSGDLAVFVPYDGGDRLLVAVLDGLGHGQEAAAASEAAEEVLRAHPSLPAAQLLERCHQALTRTRGVVMTLCWIDEPQMEVTWAGVGNVDGRLVRAGERGLSDERVLTLGGVVGYKLPPVRPTTLPLAPDDTLLLTTDGIDPGFGDALGPAVDLPAQELADRILAEHGRENDDALVVVVRLRAAS